MSTEKNSVLDGKLIDEQLGKLYRKVEEIKKRSENGTISFADALDVMQYIIIEGKAPEHLKVIDKTHEITPVKRPWVTDNYFTTLSVVSDGTTGPKWVEIFKDLSEYEKSVLLSEQFKATKGVRYKIVIIKGSLAKSKEVLTSSIEKGAFGLGFSESNLEVICLLRRMLSDEEIRKYMGFDLIVLMNKVYIAELIKPMLIGINTNTSTPFELFPYNDCGIWSQEDGFIYEISHKNVEKKSKK